MSIAVRTFLLPPLPSRVFTCSYCPPEFVLIPFAFLIISSIPLLIPGFHLCACQYSTLLSAFKTVHLSTLPPSIFTCSSCPIEFYLCLLPSRVFNCPCCHAEFSSVHVALRRFYLSQLHSKISICPVCPLESVSAPVVPRGFHMSLLPSRSLTCPCCPPEILTCLFCLPEFSPVHMSPWAHLHVVGMLRFVSYT